MSDVNKFAVTMRDLKKAQKAYKKQEPRDVVYRAATALVDLAIRKKVAVTTGEAIAVLLQSWNKAYYQYRGFDGKHFVEIESLLDKHDDTLASFRRRSIEDFGPEDEGEVEKVFKSFELLLGPVGAAKGLHLLAPHFFPLWDNAIAQNYRLRMQGRGWNAERYRRFMTITKEQVKSLGGERGIGRNPLKAIDEYNYCKARGWS